VLSGAQASPPKRRVSVSDLFLGLFLIAFVGLGIVVTMRGLVTDRRTPQSETPLYVTSAPPQVLYDPAERERLNSEIAGCVMTLVVLAFGCWRLRRRPPEPRLEPLPLTPRVGETREKWIAPPHTAQAAFKPTPRPAIRLATSRSIAAERLSAVVWTDQLARQKERA
jgi:hypothetical protein